jgi:hypothetical protein
MTVSYIVLIYSGVTPRYEYDCFIYIVLIYSSVTPRYEYDCFVYNVNSEHLRITVTFRYECDIQS